MKRVFHKTKDYKSASEWDIRQHLRMTPLERMRAARILKDRAYPADAKDVREWHTAG